jgi:signal transduction histidine kinase
VDTVAAALAFATVGAIIATRRPGNAVGWLCCAAGVGSGVVAWTGQYSRYALVTRPDVLPGGVVMLWLNSGVWVPPAAVAAVFLPLLFPNGRLPSTRWRSLVWLAASGTALLAASIALGPATIGNGGLEARNPFILGDAKVLLDVMNGLGILLMLASLAGAVAAQVVRFRRARGEERQQIKWVAYATALLVGAIVTPGALDPSSVGEDTLLSGILLSVAYPSLPVAVGMAVLRYRLYDIDVFINRTLVYGALTGCIVGLYVFVVGYLGVIFRAGSNLLISLVATGLVAMLFAPLREWLQRGVNRLMYGERDEPYRVISRLGERLESALAPDAVLPSIATTVREALRLPYAAVALHRDRAFEIAAASGQPPADVLRLPLSYQGETVGELLLGSRAPGEGFSSADRRLLGDLAHHAGVAVHGVKVMRDLQRSREQLVLAREEERRRLRRDLHDELAPTLAALGLTAATVGELIPRDPARAADVNTKLEAALRAAVGDVRRLVYDLRPPALDELGLVEAIRERAEQYSNDADLRVRVEVLEPLPPLPAAVEVAAYRIMQEALANVVRHAGARTCVIRLASSGDELRVEVVDDGIGLPASPRAGVGLRSMEERAAELGGRCIVQPAAPTGTSVSFRLPLAGADQVTKEEADGLAARADRR